MKRDECGRRGSVIIRTKTRIGGGRETVGSFRGRNAVFYRCRARGVESSRCLSAGLFVAEFTSFRAQPVNTTRVATARVTAVRRMVGAYTRRNGNASGPVGQAGRFDIITRKWSRMLECRAKDDEELYDREGF